MDFGSYLQELLKKYNINLTKLTRSIGAKSVNTMYRLFENEYSYEKNKEFTEKIIAQITLEEDEKEKLFELMEQRPLNKNLREAFDILLRLYKYEENTDLSDDYENTDLSDDDDENTDLSDDDDENTDLSNPVIDLIKEYADKEIRIFAGSNFSADLFSSLDDYFTNNMHDNIFINHIVNFNINNKTTATELFGITIMLKYSNYRCFEAKNNPLEETIILIKDDEKYILATFDEEKIFKIEVTEEYADYILRKVGRYKVKINEYRGSVTDYCDIIKLFNIIENNDMYGVSGAPCLLDLSVDVIKNLLKEANYFGMSPDSKYITDILKALETRYTLRENSSSVKRYFVNIDQIMDILKEGKPNDYIDYFRPLTNEERKDMLYNVFDTSDKSKTKCRFFKDYHACNTNSAYIDNICICISTDYNKYNEEYVNVFIEHPKALKLYKQFAEWFWENGTYSEEESRKMLEEIISKHLK